MSATLHTPFRLALAALAATVLSGTATHAGDAFAEDRAWDESAWIEVGGAVISEVSGSLRTLSSTNATDQAGEISFEPGFALYGGFREAFSDWLAAEVQGGFLYNGIDQIRLDAGGSWTPDASLMQAPIMANLVLQIPTETPLTPYLGAGAGAMVSWLDIDDVLPTGDGGFATVDESSTEIDFAYQLFAGLRYDLGSGGTISLAYHLVGSGSPQWSLESESTGARAGQLKARDLIVHSLTVGFHVAF